jgi:hypothetical protein
MNVSILALRVSDLVKQFPLIHKALRRVYCVFRPGIRFRMEKAFRSKKDIFCSQNRGKRRGEGDPIGDYLLSDSRYRGVLVEPIPHYACLLINNYGFTGRFTIEQVAIAASSDVIKMYDVAENASELLGKRFDVTAFRGIASLDRNHLVSQGWQRGWHDGVLPNQKLEQNLEAHR